MAFDWKAAVEKIAPTLASMIGGPLAGTAVGVISQAVLGRPTASDTELSAALAGATPDQIIALKKADDDFKAQMAQVDLQFEQLSETDRANARAREIATKDVTPKILAYLVVALFAVAMYLLARQEIPAANRDAMNQMIGVLYLAVGGVLNYYFGSSAGSRAKDTTIAKAVGKP